MVSLNVPIASPPTSPTPAAAGIVPLALIATALAMLAVACGSGALEAPPFDGVIAASDFAVGINCTVVLDVASKFLMVPTCAAPEGAAPPVRRTLRCESIRRVPDAPWLKERFGVPSV